MSQPCLMPSAACWATQSFEPRSREPGALGSSSTSARTSKFSAPRRFIWRRGKNTEMQESPRMTSPRLDPAPSAASPEILKAMICEETAATCAEFYGEHLRAVVLTGSLARDEATFVDDGVACALLGDADFLVV